MSTVATSNDMPTRQETSVPNAPAVAQHSPGGAQGARPATDVDAILFECESALQLARTKVPHLKLRIDPGAVAALDASQRQQLRYITREAVANLVQHSQASNATLDLWQDDRLVCFQLQDDGVGFDPDSRSGRGVAEIRRRAVMACGSALLSARPGERTRLLVEMVVERRQRRRLFS